MSDFGDLAAIKVLAGVVGKTDNTLTELDVMLWSKLTVVVFGVDVDNDVEDEDSLTFVEELVILFETEEVEVKLDKLNTSGLEAEMAVDMIGVTILTLCVINVDEDGPVGIADVVSCTVDKELTDDSKVKILLLDGVVEVLMLIEVGAERVDNVFVGDNASVSVELLNEVNAGRFTVFVPDGIEILAVGNVCILSNNCSAETDDIVFVEDPIEEGNVT